MVGFSHTSCFLAVLPAAVELYLSLGCHHVSSAVHEVFINEHLCYPPGKQPHNITELWEITIFYGKNHCLWTFSIATWQITRGCVLHQPVSHILPRPRAQPQGPVLIGVGAHWIGLLFVLLDRAGGCLPRNRRTQCVHMSISYVYIICIMLWCYTLVFTIYTNSKAMFQELPIKRSWHVRLDTQGDLEIS